jgi:CMP/dCMP kinase
MGFGRRKLARVQSHSTMTEPISPKLIIAIDGPAGAGKSTIASRLARKLSYVNLESGAMYRALALKAIESDVSFDDEAALLERAHNSQIKLEPSLGGNRVLLDGRDVTQRVRDEDVSQAASRVSVHPKVREWMVARLRELGREGGIVMEGRDIGTKVFPDADVKIFLDADPVIRERRRIQQQGSEGASAEALAAELRERDRRDRTRQDSPLVPAEGSTILDSTALSAEEVLRQVELLVEEKLKTHRLRSA